MGPHAVHWACLLDHGPLRQALLGRVDGCFLQGMVVGQA